MPPTSHSTGQRQEQGHVSLRQAPIDYKVVHPDFLSISIHLASKVDTKGCKDTIMGK